MFLFQIIATIYILLVILRVIGRYKAGRIPKSEMLLWIAFWLLLDGAVWWPRGTDLVANALGISRGYELIVAAALAALFYLTFQLFSQVHHLEHELTRLVRSLALSQSREAAKSDDDKPVL